MFNLSHYGTVVLFTLVKTIKIIQTTQIVTIITYQLIFCINYIC